MKKNGHIGLTECKQTGIFNLFLQRIATQFRSYVLLSTCHKTGTAVPQAVLCAPSCPIDRAGGGHCKEVWKSIMSLLIKVVQDWHKKAPREREVDRL